MSDGGYPGYGRGWREKKATGVARFWQIMREPATTTTWYFVGAAFIVVMLALLQFAA